MANASVDNMLEAFYNLTLETARKHIPIKTDQNKIKKDKNYQLHRNLTRRRRRINRRLIKITSESTKLKLQIELVEIEHKLQKLYKNSADFKEKKAVDAIKKNPKFFFSYAKNHMKVKTKVGPLLNDKNTLTNNSMEMAEILSSQFTKMFSTPRVDNQESKCDSATHISKLIFNEQDLIAAIDELSSTSAPGPDNFPAIMLKNCKSTLAKPLTMIWTKSYNEGKVPQSLKECIIIPTHKGGDKAAASNYRPISAYISPDKNI